MNVTVKYVLYILVCEARIPTFSSHVSTESRYGTNLSFFLFPADWSANADITRPRVVRDLKHWTYMCELAWLCIDTQYLFYVST